MTNLNNQIIERTKKWIHDFVIKLSICPFASKPFFEGKIYYSVSEIGRDFKIIQAHFLETILKMSQNLDYSNTFIILNETCSFDEYLDLYYFLEELLIQGNLDSTFQLASFHPNYIYNETNEEDSSNFRNRSPYPMIHILRVIEVEAAIEEYGDTSNITNRNIELLEGMDVPEFLKEINQK